MKTTIEEIFAMVILAVIFGVLCWFAVAAVHFTLKFW